ncbi:putative mitochondrial chaperone BCS1 [Aulographum hederae CBS 113979]|uniref:Putative mitochondrial chaperone BCS1 n=1 Tax=Aulographum hederae CBS 113979 TaxID=1176131 RepID=A0A6G1H2P8_9PEZI|nr:putative mitochondrial chaperone BCS1 [Aulographum hederae CBS 113979]
MDGNVASSSPSVAPVKQLAEPLTGVEAAKPSGTQSFLAQYTDNPFFSAGFGLAVLATAARFGQQGLKRGVDFARRRLLVDVEITRHDDAYDWFLRWMSAHQRSQMAGTSLSPETTRSKEPRGIIANMLDKILPRLHHLQIKTSKGKGPDGSAQTQFSLVPGQGAHILRYRNAFISVNRQRQGNAVDIATGTPFETVTLTTLYSHRHIFEALFTEAHAHAQQLQEGKTTVFTPWGAEWRAFGEPRRKRPLDSVILEEGVAEHIVADLKEFLSARTWYLDRGIPYRRGYLLYGPPGTGKSSFIQALAGHLDHDIAMLSVSERGMTDDRLNHLLLQVPQRTVVVLEDADAAFVNRAKADADGYAGATVTFSGLLNALDGIASAEERIIFLTTNHVERMDEALLRPGRVDLPARIGYATEWQIEKLWERFYLEQDKEGEGKKRFMERVRELGLVSAASPAMFQGFFLVHKGDVEGAIEKAGDLVVGSRDKLVG